MSTSTGREPSQATRAAVGKHSARVTTLTLTARPWTVNAERSGGTRGHGHWTATRELTRQWRQAFMLLAQAQRPKPHYPQAHIHVHTNLKPPLPDTGNVYPAAKAAIDGLVDAGLLPDDSPKHVLSITLTAPTPTTKGQPDSMTVVLTPPDQPLHRR